MNIFKVFCIILTVLFSLSSFAEDEKVPEYSAFCSSDNELIKNGKIDQITSYLECSQGVYLDNCTAVAGALGLVGGTALREASRRGAFFTDKELTALAIKHQDSLVKSKTSDVSKEQLKQFKERLNVLKTDLKKAKGTSREVYVKKDLKDFLNRLGSSEYRVALTYDELPEQWKKETKQLIRYNHRFSFDTPVPKSQLKGSTRLAKKLPIFGGIVGAAVAVAIEAVSAPATGCGELGQNKIHLDSKCNPIYSPDQNVLKFLSQSDEDICKDLKASENLRAYYGKMMKELFDVKFEKTTCSKNSITVQTQDQNTNKPILYKLDMTDKADVNKISVYDVDKADKIATEQPKYRIRISSSDEKIISFSSPVEGRSDYRQTVLASDFIKKHDNALVQQVSKHAQYMKLAYPGIKNCCKSGGSNDYCSKLGFSKTSNKSDKTSNQDAVR